MGKKRQIGYAVATFTVLLAVSGVAYADHPAFYASEKTIKLQDLLNEALRNNAALKASAQGGVAKTAAVGPAGSLDNPGIGFEARNYPTGSGRGETPSVREREVSLSQRVPFPGKRARLEDVARKEVESQTEEIRVERASIINKTKYAYYELFVWYRKSEVLSDQKNVVRSLIATARRQYSLGKIPQADVLNLQLEEATLVGQSLSIDRQIKSTLGEINHLLGRSDHGKYLVGRPEDIQKTPFDFGVTSEAKLFERATLKNPTLSSRRAMMAASEFKLAYSDLNMWPDFDFEVGYTFRDKSADPGPQDSISAKVGVSLPLWTGSRQSEERKRSIAEKAQAGFLLEEQQIDLAHNIHATYAELEEASRRLKLFEEATIPLSKQALASAQNGYLTGKVEFSLLLGIIQKRSQLELEYVEALATYQKKIADLEFLTGDSLGGS